MGGFLSVVISAMAVWMDLREEAVDNSWVLFFDYGRFFTTALEKGPKGMIIFLTGAAVPLILLGILFIFRMLGAGDVKILCALGGIMGPRTVTECIVYSLLAGAGISLAILISTGGIRQRILYLYQYMNEFYCTGENPSLLQKRNEASGEFSFYSADLFECIAFMQEVCIEEKHICSL